LKNIIFNKAIDFILPRFCTSCERKLGASESSLCNSCVEKLKYASNERIQSEFSRKFSDEKIIKDFGALFLFYENSVIQKLIHSLKYQQNYHIAKFISEILYDRLAVKISEWKADIIIPVPLHSVKRSERGYNQAEEIAGSISSLSGIPCNSKILKRSKYTGSQTTLNLEERKRNISGAFSLKNKKCIKGKRIVIVDDVITTGATVTECGMILKQNSAGEIFALSAAIAK